MSSDLKSVVINALEVLAKAAGTRLDPEIRAELVSEFEYQEARVARLEAKAAKLEDGLEQLEGKVDQPDWRQRT